jgi:hypothetical protein
MELTRLEEAGQATPRLRAALQQSIEQVRKGESELSALPLAKAIAQDGAAKALGCPKPKRP